MKIFLIAISCLMSVVLKSQPCNSLQINIGTPQLKRCANNTYFVDYSNTGNETINNCYATVQFPPEITFIGASLPYSDLGGNLYQFNLGNLTIAQTGNFTINTNLACNNSILGQQHCVEANIYPICTGFTLPVISVTSRCLIDSIEFKIKNIGFGNMNTPLQYHVVEDQILYRSGTFILNTGTDSTIRVLASGSTYYLEAEQVDSVAFYGLASAHPSAVVENCHNINPNSIGMASQFPTPDDFRSIDIDCQQSVNEQIFNIKSAYPIGVTSSHYIANTDVIEYKIAFQNTGLGIVQNIVIDDTLDNNLEIATLELGSYSDSYSYQLISPNIIRFVLNGINLPDSNTNFNASIGFVSFRIKPIGSLAEGTVIKNKALIYFDSQAPIVTNTVFHTIGNALRNITFIQNIESEIGVSIAPNPFENMATVTLNHTPFVKLSYAIYNTLGQVVQTNTFSNTNTFQINKENLSEGLYFCKIYSGNKLLNSGKIMVK